MTNLLARILLSLFMLPLAGLVYAVVVAMIAGGTRNEDLGFFAATAVTAAFVVVYWVRLWRHGVVWTKTRIFWTWFAGVICVFGGAVIAAIVAEAARIRDESFMVFLGGIISMITWLTATVLIWRETPAERADRIRRSAGDVLLCPRCGYNMTGLYESRCPECGARFTLDQLYGSQERREIADAGTEAGVKAET